MLDKIRRKNLHSVIVEMGMHTHLPFRKDDGTVMTLRNGRYVTPAYSFYLLVFKPFTQRFPGGWDDGTRPGSFDVNDVDHLTKTFVSEISKTVKDWFYDTWKAGIVGQREMGCIRANVARCEKRMSCPP